MLRKSETRAEPFIIVFTVTGYFLVFCFCCERASKWLEDEPERKKKRREEKRKRLQQKKIPPKHFFNDQAYMQQLRANEEDMDSALKQGIDAVV